MTSLTVNGHRVQVDRPDDTPLLTVLRDALGLVGSRFGCGQGLCGACTAPEMRFIRQRLWTSRSITMGLSRECDRHLKIGCEN